MAITMKDHIIRLVSAVIDKFNALSLEEQMLRQLCTVIIFMSLALFAFAMILRVIMAVFSSF